MPAHEAPPFFSESYNEARLKFLARAQSASFQVTSHKHPTATGPDGEALYMDIADAGPPNAAHSLLLISATHGVEGFCGSACQIGFLSSGDLRRRASGLRVMLVHALNPYGFAWLRRVNEDNVDLNRNFRNHDNPYPVNAGYDELAHVIAPKDISPASIEKADQMFLEYGRTHGFDTLQRAITGGQYHHADGLYFGGNAPTWSNRIFHTAAIDCLGKSKRLAAIDFHTGLGPSAHGELISVEAEQSDSFKTASSWWSGAVKSTKQGTSISADLEGTIGGAMGDILPKTETVFVAAEFGTVDPMDVLGATRDDNWLYLHGDANNYQGAEIRRRMRQAFYPDSAEWKQKVWTQAQKFIGNAIDGLASEG